MPKCTCHTDPLNNCPEHRPYSGTPLSSLRGLFTTPDEARAAQDEAIRRAVNSQLDRELAFRSKVDHLLSSAIAEAASRHSIVGTYEKGEEPGKLLDTPRVIRTNEAGRVTHVDGVELDAAVPSVAPSVGDQMRAQIEAERHGRTCCGTGHRHTVWCPNRDAPCPNCPERPAPAQMLEEIAEACGALAKVMERLPHGVWDRAEEAVSAMYCIQREVRLAALPRMERKEKPGHDGE